MRDVFWMHLRDDCLIRVYAYIKEHFTDDNISFVDLKGINDVEVLYNEKGVEAVVNKMRAEKVNGIFLINSNFGNEEVAALVTEELKRYHVPFTYIENCRVEDEIFAEGLKRVGSVACMVTNFKGMRIAQIGMHVIPINMAVIIDRYNKVLNERDAELEEGAKLLESRYQMDELTPPMLKKIYAFVLLYQELFEEYDLDALPLERKYRFLENLRYVILRTRM